MAFDEERMGEALKGSYEMDESRRTEPFDDVRYRADAAYMKTFYPPMCRELLAYVGDVCDQQNTREVRCLMNFRIRCAYGK